jgi:hypothetical protein
MAITNCRFFCFSPRDCIQDPLFETDPPCEERNVSPLPPTLRRRLRLESAADPLTVPGLSGPSCRI